MSDIKTWHQRAMAHPDHQSGMISEDMIRARMCEEIEDLRAEIERLRNEADLTREALGGWALVPPDGGADPTHERVAAVVAEVARIKKLHAPPADLPWPSREEGKP